MDGLKKAIEAAGGPIAFARALGINRQAVWAWKRVPADRIIQIETLTGVSREELRPDLFTLRKEKRLRTQSKSEFATVAGSDLTRSKQRL
jgi:DNA-binding transcriptional regulator YdaS (Cro superfamily)